MKLDPVNRKRRPILTTATVRGQVVLKEKKPAARGGGEQMVTWGEESGARSTPEQHPVTTAAPGWYADPQQPGFERYWSGTLWAEHCRPVPTRQPATASSVMPFAPILEKRSYSSPLSYVGATSRTIRWARRVGTDPAKAILAWSAAVLWLAFMYTFLLMWYFVVFFCFGIFTFPYRLVRRSHRRREHLQEVQLATMQQMLLAQQHAVPASQPPPPPAAPSA